MSWGRDVVSGVLLGFSSRSRGSPGYVVCGMWPIFGERPITYVAGMLGHIAVERAPGPKNKGKGPFKPP
jgi:hypothetical protein